MLERIETATLAAFAEPGTRARLRRIGIEAAPLGAVAFDRLVTAEHPKSGEVGPRRRHPGRLTTLF